MDPISSILDIDNTFNGDLFPENYVKGEEIGKGTYSQVFHCKDHQGNDFAIKRYELTDSSIINAFRDAGYNPEDFVKNIAKREKEIGYRLDHSNIVKVHEVIQRSSTAYVVMDYIPGESFSFSQEYTNQERSVFLSQFLDAVEHILERGVLFDDLYSSNVIISHNRLIIIDLGGYELDAYQENVEHYLGQLEHMITILGGELGVELLQKASNIDQQIRGEDFNDQHFSLLLDWVKSVKKSI
ncbi:MAG: hypothetical protein Tsb0021_17390 [Chlamydiales bacterium]